MRRENLILWSEIIADVIQRGRVALQGGNAHKCKNLLTKRLNPILQIFCAASILPRAASYTL